MSKHFELLNYSEHGTIVDNVVYCCDVTGKASDDDSKEKEKKSMFQGTDNLLRRNNSDKTTNTSGIASQFEKKEVSSIHSSNQFILSVPMNNLISCYSV